MKYTFCYNTKLLILFNLVFLFCTNTYFGPGMAKSKVKGTLGMNNSGSFLSKPANPESECYILRMKIQARSSFHPSH